MDRILDGVRGHVTGVRGKGAALVAAVLLALVSPAGVLAAPEGTTTDNKTTVGTENTATGAYSFAAGYKNTAGGENSFAAGYGNTASGARSGAIGYSNSVTTADSYVLGSNSSSKSGHTLAMGYNNSIAASSQYSLAIGAGTQYVANSVTGSFSALVGYNNKVNASNAYVFGGLSSASAKYGLAAGYSDFAAGEKSTALGYNNSVSGTESTALGADNAIAPMNSSGNADTSTAIGYGNQISSSQSISLGNKNTIREDGGLAIGTKNMIRGASSLAVGTGHTVTGAGSGAIGDPDGVYGDSSYILGNNSNIYSEDSFVIGNESSVGEGSFDSKTFVVTVGTDAPHSVVLGSSASSTVSGGVALGYQSVASTKAEISGYDPVTGEVSTETLAAWRSTAAAVSVGDAGNNVTRQITNVAAGSEDTDAANVAQLKALSGVSVKYDVKDSAVDTSSITLSGTKITGLTEGSISNGSTDAITGGQLYDEIHVAEDGTYIASKKTVAENLKALDSAVDSNTSAVSALTSKVDSHESTITSLNKDVNTNKENISKIEAATETNAAGIADLDDRVGTLSEDGTWISASSSVSENLTALDSAIASFEAGGGHNTVAAGDNITVSESENDAGGTLYTVSMKPDIEVDSVTAGKTVLNSDGVTVGSSVKMDAKGFTAGKVSVTASGINAGGNKVTGVAAGDISENSTDAVNGSQLYKEQEARTAADKVLQNQIDNIQQITTAPIYDSINEVGAGAAALANLQYFGYEPGQKLNVAVGFGAYRNKQAAAVGARYFFNEDIAMNMSTALGNGDNMYGMGVSFRVGQRTPRAMTLSAEAAMRQEIDALKKDNARLASKNAELEERLARVERMLERQ